MLSLMLALAFAHPVPGGPPAECKSAYGKTECGYGCIAAYGDVRCARTPEGRCQAAYGEITCWDPVDDAPPMPPRPRPHEPRESRNGADCKSAYGKTACGYACEAAYGDLQCAATPLGVCHAAYGKITCWDPPRWVRGGEKASCEAAYGQVACGYRCLAAYGKIKCASSPDGACTAAYGDVTCSN